MSTVNQDELKAIKVLKFEGKESEWERWSEKFVALARARGFAGILLGTEQAPNADEDIDRKKTDGSYELTDAERKEKKRLRQANGNAYINLQLSCEDLPYDLVSLAKTEELPDGCARDAWERLTSEYDLTEGEDKITLLTMFQKNQLEDVRTNITVWLTSLAMQVIKLKKLNHVLDEEYQITHILASLPKEYSSVVEQVKIDRRTSSTLITMDEIKKRLKERYLQLKKEHGWSEEEMALNVKSGNNQNKNVKKGNKGKFFKGRCNHCGKYGHKKADCWDLKNKKEKPQENEKKVQKDKSKIRCYKCGQLGHYANECKNDKESNGGGNNETFAMTCFEEEEDNKNENGDDENKFESKNSEDDERKVGPGTPRNTMEPQRTPPTQTNVFTTQVTNEWAMSTIENNSATPRDLSSARAWMESSKYGEYEKSRNMINVPLAREKSTLKDGCNNDAQRTGENVARAQPNLSHEEDEIQNSNFEHVPSKRPSEDPEEDDRKPAAKRIKKEPEDDAQSVIQDDTKVENVVKPWEDKKDYEAVFRQHIYIGTDGEEHYDVIDMERDAQRAVRRITDHQEIAKQYQKVVRAYKNYMRDHPWMTEGLMQDNCRFGDLLKDEKRKSQLKYELGRLMGEYAVPLPLGNFSLNNKETRRLELWKNRRGMWCDHVEHMEEGPEQNKEYPDEDLQLEEDEDQDEQEEEIEPEEDEQEVIQVGQSQAEEPTETPVGVASGEPVASRTRSQTTASEPVAARTRQALGTNPEMSAFAGVKDDKTLNEWLHEIAFVTSTMSDPDEPQSFQEAWWDPDLISREKWREAIRLEFKKMLDMGVWRHVKRNARPNYRRLVGCRWVFKVKRNGVYRARLVAKGFSQIPGVDFTDNYSPVVNDVTFRTVVARMIIENMKGKVVDIDNAFLNGDLEHEIYMKIPEGYDEVINPGVDKEDCLILQKAIYGLVQAARQFWKKIVDKMQEGGFKLSEADPCMLYKEDEKGVCIIIIYIDDMLIIGKEEAIDDAIKVLQGHFQVKDPTSLEDYLGVQIVQSDDGKKAWLGQPTIIKSLEKQFGERVAKKKMTVTPGTPGFIGGKVDDISKVDEKTQSMYRSGVGTLLYLTKHSRPDITNPVRELSKSMDGASMAQVTEMYRVINFVLETKTLGLRMVPIFNDGVWKLEALSDSDFANDKDTRYSVYGYIIYFCGVPVAWKSKSMKSVVLSTTEAEYVAVSEVVKEIKFLYQMLRSMEIKVPLPIKVQVDNVGAIWLANNSSVSERTKHVDLRAHFVRDMIKDQVIEINFVKSAENDSDIMTKNQQGQHYMYAKSKLVYTVQEMNDEKDIQDEETGRMLES